MTTHTAIITTAPRAPLETTTLPTPTPTSNEVLIHNLYTASTPLDLHQADGGLLVTHPQVLGDTVGGRVVAVGPTAQRLKVGDLVFGFSWRCQPEKAFQDYVCCPENLLAKVSDALDEDIVGKEGEAEALKRLVTVPNNFVSAWHAIVTDLGIELPWPKPEGNVPPNGDRGNGGRILIWGGSSSVGQYALQILKAYGYKGLVATASRRNEELVRWCGAEKVFDYSDPRLAERVQDEVGEVDLVLDCIGSLEGSLRPISKIVKGGSVVAVMLPVIVRDASEEGGPEYAMAPETAVEWEEGVAVRGVRTHFYLENEWHARRLQSEIMPSLLREALVRPNLGKVVEGGSMLERAERAVGMLRRKEVSGERLVWRVSDLEDRGGA